MDRYNIVMDWSPPNNNTMRCLKELMTDEEQAIYKYAAHKRRQCRKGPGFKLDPFWIRYMLRRDGQSVYDIGRNKGCIHLARYGDTGDYTVENARFLDQRENLQERETKYGAWTPERRQAASDRMKKHRIWEQS